MTTSKRKTRKNTTSAKNKKNLIKNEIKLLLFITVAILIELSLFGLGGKIGHYVSRFMFGLMGLMAYLFPILVFLGAAFLISNKNRGKAIIKIITGSVLVLVICAIIQLITGGHGQDKPIITYYIHSANYHTGGGLFGGLISKGLYSVTGIYVTYVILIVIFIICIVIITEKSFIHGVKRGSSKVYNTASTARKDVKKIMEERELNKEAEKRAEKKVRGVQVVKLKDPDISKDDIHEISSEGFNERVFQEKVETNYQDQVQGEETSLPDATLKHPSKTNTVQKEDNMEEYDIQDVKVEDSNYVYPPLSLLNKPARKNNKSNADHLNQTAMKLQQILENFGVNVTVTDYSQGPSVTRYELQPEMGTKVSRITSLVDDIKLNLAVADIRIEAPIPGKAAVGIEVPNSGSETVYLRELLESKELLNHPSKISFGSGKDIGGKVVVADIAKMPHMLVAGTTGSGKSVFMNSIIMTILLRAKPSEVKLIIIDPKVVEFGVYNGIPHLLNPVVTDPKMAASVLNWAVAEMSRRYKVLAEHNVRDFKSYNEKIEKEEAQPGEEKPDKMPQILIIIDELADLMMAAAKTVEDSICRLAQLARAAGIHLIIATQRPSVDVVTGLIKANVPSRVALLVSSGTDSRTILDMNGAEKLLGNGDMLFYPSGYVKPVRVQGAYVSDSEVAKVVEFLKENVETSQYDSSVKEHIELENTEAENIAKPSNNRDEYFVDAGRFIIEREKASASMLQRKFNIGFNRAARIVDQLHEMGVVGEEEGPKPRKVIMSLEGFESIINNEETEGE